MIWHCVRYDLEWRLLCCYFVVSKMYAVVVDYELLVRFIYFEVDLKTVLAVFVV